MKKEIAKTLLILGAIVFLFLYFWGYVSASSLRWVNMPELRYQMRNVCGEPHQLFPGSILEWPFPAFSPDGRYYVDIGDARLRRAQVLKLYQTDTKQLLGTYSYFKIRIFCWAPDSSGIYAEDYIPGSSTLFIPFSGGGHTGPVKKLLVP